MPTDSGFYITGLFGFLFLVGSSCIIIDMYTNNDENNSLPILPPENSHKASASFSLKYHDNDDLSIL